MNQIFLVLLVLFLICIKSSNSIEIRATKGKYFLHNLHSASFFRNTVDVKWSATIKGRPKLPVWLNLMRSKYGSFAYLHGTPVTPASQVLIHVIARRLDNFEQGEQFITLVLDKNDKYNSTTQQILEIHVKSVEAEDLLTDRTGMLQRVEAALIASFKAKDVDPYIFNILPVRILSQQTTYLNQQQKFGSIIQVGAQKPFHMNILNLERGLRKNPRYCSRNNLIPIDRIYKPLFTVNWCNFQVKNLTNLNEEKRRFKTDELKESTILTPRRQGSDNRKTTEDETMIKQIEETSFTIKTSSHFWESILLFPILGVTCILLLILLSVIFFGRREGQHWRDYKTPKEVLQDYRSMRDSQRQLREMSAQRQLLEPYQDRVPSRTSASIHTFLRPRDSSQYFQFGDLNMDTAFSTLNKPYADHHDASPKLNEVHNNGNCVTKQTVAEAAKACGSSLHLYRNPFQDELSECDEEEDEEENDEKDAVYQESLSDEHIPLTKKA